MPGSSALQNVIYFILSCDMSNVRNHLVVCLFLLLFFFDSNHNPTSDGWKWRNPAVDEHIHTQNWCCHLKLIQTMIMEWNEIRLMQISYAFGHCVWHFSWDNFCIVLACSAEGWLNFTLLNRFLSVGISSLISFKFTSNESMYNEWIKTSPNHCHCHYRPPLPNPTICI